MIIGTGVVAVGLLTVLIFPSVRSQPFPTPSVDIQLVSVEFYDDSDDTDSPRATNAAVLKVIVEITYLHDRPESLKNINYELFADGKSVGSSSISHEGLGDKNYPSLSESFNATSLVIQNQDRRPLSSYNNDTASIVWSIYGTAQFQNSDWEYLQTFSDKLDH